MYCRIGRLQKSNSLSIKTDVDFSIFLPLK